MGADITVEVFAGFGPVSAGVLSNVARLVELLRREGIRVQVSEIRLPLLDEEFEAFVRINGVEVYIPSVPVDEETLLDYVLWRLSQESNVFAGFPLPPIAANV